MMKCVAWGLTALAVGFAGNAVAGTSTSGKGLHGSIFGKAFSPNRILIRKLLPNTAKIKGRVVDTADCYILKFQVGKEFMPDQLIEVWFNVDANKSLDGYRLSFKPYKFGTPEFSAQAYPVKKDAAVGRGVTMVVANAFSRSMSYSDQVGCELRFGHRRGNQLPGKIVLKAPEGQTVEGAFIAVFEENP